MTTALFLAVLLSALIHATWNVAAKGVGGSLGVMWSGQVLAATCLVPFALHFGPILPESWTVARYLVLTGIIQSTYFALLSRAYRQGDISVVYPIARGCGVACTVVAATLLVGESLSAVGVTGILAVCAGTLLLGLGRGSPEGRGALKYALAIGVNLAAGGINDKFAVGVMHPVVYIFWMFTIAALCASPFVLSRARESVLTAIRVHRKQVVLVGLGSMSSYLIILFVLKEGPIAYIVAMRELSVVLGAIWGFAVLKERMNRGRLLGIASILAGLVLIKLA